MTQEILDKINKFTRREFAADELFAFPVILCDNEIDRDCERFSDKALEQLKALFVGKTGIFDHEPSTSNQTARIFDTELVTDSSRKNKCGEPYKYLRASAHMVRTEDNRDLIAEIDGGIKKEVSISCSAGRRRCSVCGADKAVQSCSHVKGKTYGGRLCHVVLDDITDAYEWSFVAVPAQVNAGVTKRFTDNGAEKSASAETAENERLLRCEIRRLAFISGGRKAAFAAELAAHGLNEVQLKGMKRAYEKLAGHTGAEVQLSTEPENEQQTSAFKL